MMRLLWLPAVLVVVAACHETPPAPPPRAAAPKTVASMAGDLSRTAPAIRQAIERAQMLRPTMSVMPPVVAPPEGAAADASAKTIDRYAAFSSDGLLFAYALLNASTGVQELRFQSTTTNTVEKTMPLDAAHRAEADAALKEENFPGPSAASSIPKQLSVEQRDGSVVLTFSGMPASKTHKPFAGVVGVKIDKVEVIAASKDGKHAAVRIIGTPPGGASGLTEFHVFSVFG